MSYLAFARKYRPQTFAEVIGQHSVVKTLQNALSSKRLHHAYLFTGARGIGKTTVARILAKAINCESGPASEPCCKCQSCLDIANASSLAVQEIDGASNTSVEDVRVIREQVKYNALGGKYKIYIIDEVHMLSTPAFNALLKTLEEPPPNVIFMFATTEAQKIPATILSRCQRYDLKRLSPLVIEESLKKIANKESISIDDGALKILSIEADGSLRDAQSLFDQAVAYSGKEVKVEHVEEMLGATDRNTIYTITENLANSDAKSALEQLDLAYERGADLSRLATDLLSLFRHILVILACKGEKYPADMPIADVDRLKKISSMRPISVWQQSFNIMYSTCSEIARSAIPKASLDVALIKLSQVEDVLPIADLLSRLSSSSPDVPAESKTINRQKAPDVQKKSEVVTTIKATNPSHVESNQPKQNIKCDLVLGKWSDFVQWLKTKDMKLSSIISQGVIDKGLNEEIEISFVSPFHASMLDDKECGIIFKNALNEFFGSRVMVKIMTQNAETKKNKKSTVASTNGSDDAIKNAKDILGAAIQEVKG